jgi:tetratricopeptide (TPR) repeat protein
LKENFGVAKQIYSNAEKAVEDRYSVTDLNYGYELSKISSILIKLGEYTKADSLLKKALAIAKDQRNQDDAKVIDIYQKSASLLNTMGDYESANKLLNGC